MTETKWAETPWVVHPGRTSGCEVVAPNAPKTRRRVARCGGVGREANARLIAAAPEMAEALRPFVEAYQKALEGHTDGFVKNRGPDHVLWGWNGQEFTIGMFEAARAALAKAEGRDND